MHNTSNTHIKLAATIFFLTQCGIAVAADEKLISGNIAASQLWDDNFFQNADETPEQITVLNAGLALSKNISRQQFSARWRVRSYQHADYEKFDEILQDGSLRWYGAWGEELTSNLEWVRDAYLVDRWETPEGDVDSVAKEDAKFALTYGSQNRFSVQVGGRQSKQNHSSISRNNLDYEENEGFAGLTYRTPSQSTLTLRYRSGDRTYVNRVGESLENNFDFDYRQLELENIWKISAKTTSKLTLARLEREGTSVINNTSGNYALLDFSWDATPKVQWHLGYSFTHPAQGDTIDKPTDVKTGFVSVTWNISQKVVLSSRVEKVSRNYADVDEKNPRAETQYNFIPLSINYAIYDSLSLRLDTTWRKNESPRLLTREYEASQVMVGLNYRF
jgi:hypothetical protein